MQQFPASVAVGGMSSRSFDNAFSPESGDAPGFCRTPESRPAASRTPSLPFLITKERMISDASPWAVSALRRGVECGVAATALVCLMPLLLLAAALVWLDSEGPVLFRQERMGRNGQAFTLYKFRSMRTEVTSTACITARGDIRITRAGAFLRRHKLDELPQFWNVLRGDMGLVGPRPKLPHLEPLHMMYRPGITGPATLAFRHEETMLSELPPGEVEAFYDSFIKPAKAFLDLEYMRTATARSDAQILWKTFSSCLDRSQSAAKAPENLYPFPPPRTAEGASSSTAL